MGARATRPRMIVGVASRWLLHQMAQDQIRRFPADRVNTAKKGAQAKGGPGWRRSDSAGPAVGHDDQPCPFALWVPEIVSLAPDLGFLHPDWSVANGSRANLGSGTISSRDLPPALPDLRAAMRLAAPAAPL
jgi:hypothetical protein